MFSVFTPTHDATHLVAAYQSLLDQNAFFPDLEWILGVNGGVTIPQDIRNDKNVRIIELTGDARIGNFKKQCCDAARGRVLVELDHDDVLTPSALRKIAAEVERGAGFIYSDCALFWDQDGTPPPFDESYGWESYPAECGDIQGVGMRCFELTPASLSQIYYAPDHVRCWTREAYDKAGGHDPLLEVGDDHDLVCRTYLAGVKFAHIPSCEYFYRKHARQTTKQKQAEIAAQQQKNQQKYLQPLIDEWLRRNGRFMLNLTPQVDLLTHLQNYITESYGAIRTAPGTLPCLAPGTLPRVMEEIYRILTPGGYLCLQFPRAGSDYAYLAHYRSQFNEYSLAPFVSREFRQGFPPCAARFQKLLVYHLRVEQSTKANTVDVAAELCALKGQRQPGRVFI